MYALYLLASISLTADVVLLGLCIIAAAQDIASHLAR
jgi:hypothetical protein